MNNCKKIKKMVKQACNNWLPYIVCALVLFFVASCSKYKYEKVEGDPLNTRIYTLDNGLKIYLSVNKDQPRIWASIVVHTGSRNDPAETTGLAHYLEHLMFKGTSKIGVTDAEAEAPLLADIEQRYEKYRKMTDPEERTQAYRGIDSVSQLAARYLIPNEYTNTMAALGAENVNAGTTYDYTSYDAEIHSNQVENWAKIESERMKGLVVRGFHTELETVYEEYNMLMSQDNMKLLNGMMAKLFPSHPYSRSIGGTQEHLKNPSITNIMTYYKKWYVPDNTAICISGDLDPDEMIATIDKYFGSWQPSGDVEQPSFPKQPELTQPTDTTVFGNEAEMLWLGLRFDKGASLNDTLCVIRKMLNNNTAGLIDLDLIQQGLLTEGGVYEWMQQLTDYSTLILTATPVEGQTLDDARSLLPSGL